MKRYQMSLSIAALAVLLLASCQKDDMALTPNDLNAHMLQQATGSAAIDLDGSSSLVKIDSVKFELWYDLLMEYPVCPEAEFTTTNNEVSNIGLEGNANMRCLGSIHATGSGQGFSYELGRVLTHVDVNYDAENKRFCGRLTLGMEEGDKVVLTFCSTPSMQGDTLNVDELTQSEGTGRFEEAEFEGDLKMTNVQDFFDPTSNSASIVLVVDGLMMNAAL